MLPWLRPPERAIAGKGSGVKETIMAINGILGKKVGMTQLFDSNGYVRPATVLQAGPCVITQRKAGNKDG